ncbi:MAG: hypothetical protein HKN87_12450 [Saprospiraceae bacterium]|nr:hypothetical protein [Saprospiraceae bacterium]
MKEIPCLTFILIWSILYFGFNQTGHFVISPISIAQWKDQSMLYPTEVSMAGFDGWLGGLAVIIEP